MVQLHIRTPTDKRQNAHRYNYCACYRVVMHEKDISNTPVPLEIKAGVHYWVQCKGYRCLAIKNTEGVWKSVGTGNVIPDVIEVIPF